MVTAQQLAEEAKQKAQYEKYRKDRQRMQLIQTPNYLNSFSKGIYNGGQKVSDLGSKLASSESPAFQEIGGKLQTFGDGMQTASGRPFVNSLKDKAGQFLASKLTPYEPGTTAIGQGLTEAIPSASSQLPSTIGTTAGTTGLEAAASGLGTGASTTAAGSGSALSGALASATGAGTAGTAAGTGSALGSAIGSATAGTTTAAGAGAAGAGLGTAALGALGPIGIGIAAASILYNLFNSAQKKKQQEAMQKDMENVAQTQQADAEKKNELMNEYDQTINNNIQNLSQETQPTTDNQGLISSLIGSVKDRFNGTPTGGASNVNNTVNAPLPNIQIPMPEEQQATEQPAVQQVAQDPQLSLKQKLFNGFKDIYAGYQDNSKNGFMQGDVYNQLNVPEEVEPTQEEGIITGGASKVQPKSGWQRVGEAFGTGQRLLSNPIVQGLIAGSLYAKDKGDALYGLGKGVEWAQNKAKSNYYSDELGQPRTVFSNFDSKDYNARTLSDYRDTMANNAKLKSEAQLDRTNPKMIDFANARLASGEWTPEEYNEFINSENYMPDNRMSLETIKTMADKKSKEAKANTDAIKANTDKAYKGKLGDAALSNASANGKRADAAMINAQNKPPQNPPKYTQDQVTAIYNGIRAKGYSDEEANEYLQLKGIK